MNINTVFSSLLIQAKGTIVVTGSIAGIIPYIFGSAYNASKAALQSYISTLRVELAPYNVHVINVITGGVKSNIARTKRTLPEGSYFKPWEDMYTNRQVHSQSVGMDTRVYADQVVNEILTSRGTFWNRNEIWAGYGAKIVRVTQMIDWMWPGGIFGIVLTRMLHYDHSRLTEVKKRI